MGIKNSTYCYDRNGNMVSGDGRSVQYTAYDMPTRIEKGGTVVSFFYGPDRKRYKRIDETVTDGISTTVYVADKAYERITKGANIDEKVYIGDFAVMTRTVAGASSSLKTEYLHRDHLESVDTITDETGAVVQRMSFDAFGKRRETNWAAMTNEAVASFDTSRTKRGFTGHEMIDPVGLVHMNGRVYEPEVGRFLSADPVVEDIDNLQTYNRYSYVRNNPLTLTDPSGFQSAEGNDGNNTDSHGDAESESASTNVDAAKVDDPGKSRAPQNQNTNTHQNQSKAPDLSMTNISDAVQAQTQALNVSTEQKSVTRSQRDTGIQDDAIQLPGIVVYSTKPEAKEAVGQNVQVAISYVDHSYNKMSILEGGGGGFGVGFGGRGSVAAASNLAVQVRALTLTLSKISNTIATLADFMSKMEAENKPKDKAQDKEQTKAEDKAQSKAQNKTQDKAQTDKQKKGTPRNNQAQNKQFRDAARGLNKEQQRQLHEEITGQNLGYHDIKAIADAIKRGEY